VTKKGLALATLIVVLLTQRPHAQSTARIFFVDIGQGASTLLVSPTGKTLLVDGGPPGGGTKVASLLNTLGIATIDFTVLTHYHIDHDSGLIELLNAGRVAGIAYDNGDGADVQPPGTSTSPTSTRGTYLNYVTATGHAGVTRQTIVPGQVLDLGGGMKATVLAAGGHLLSGGSVQITNDDLNSESISLLVEYNNFDFIISGDLTGGGSTSTDKTPDVETFVGQMAGDVDVIQLNHHGSTTTSNQVYLSAVKAEVAVAQAGTTNTFGHPNRETVNKYLNTPVTSGNVFAGTGVPSAGAGPVFYQHEASPSGDDRVTQQGYGGASAPNAGNGTIELETDGTTTYSLKSFDDGGVRLDPNVHVYPVDGISPGITTDFPPTVIAQTMPVVPLASDTVVVSAAVNDRESPITGVTLNYSLNGAIQSPLAMTLASGVYQATIPAQPDGTRVDFAVTGSTGVQTTTYTGGYFSGVTDVAAIRATNALGEPLYNGYAARIDGTVTAGSNTFASGTNDDYVQDGTGGINVFRSTDTATPFSATVPGQVVEVIGRIAFNGGRQRLDITESLEKATSPYGISVASSGSAPVPAAMTIAALNLDPESFEGKLVSISNCQITAGTIPVTPQSVDAFVTISDGTGSFQLKVDHDTDIEGFNPGTTFTVIGIIQQDDFLRPFNSGYDIAPRGRPDLGGTAAGATLLSIADARIDAVNNADGTPGSDFVPDLLNQLVKVRGAVTSTDFRGGNGIEYYIQDATGGIDVFNSTQNFGPFAIGDSVEAIGLVTQFNGLTEITVSSVTALAPGTVAAATPQLVTLTQLADGGVGEALEGRLIQINDVTVTAGTFPAAGADGNVTIADATGSATLRIDKDTNIGGSTTPAGTFAVVGVLGQFDPSAPFDSGYQLFPRSLADITGTGVPSISASPTTFDFGPVLVGGSAFKNITITNNSAATVTLTTPFTLGGANADQFSVGAPGVTNLVAGGATSVSVTFHPTAALPAAKAATLNIGSSGGSALVSLTGTAQTSGGGGSGSPVVISEFRFRGPGGASDEFIELYNNSDAPFSIGGHLLRGSNNAAGVTTRATVPAGRTIPARGHYLFVNTAASAALLALADQTYGVAITDDGGIALTLADLTTVIDQVGLSSGSAFKEGTPLATFGASNTNQGYERKAGGVNGSQQDTNNNSADFQVKTPSDPQNLSSMPTPAIAVSPTSVNFGSVVVGGSSSIDLTITNLSASSSVTLDVLSLGGGNPASFSVGAAGTNAIGPGASTSVSVTFQPPSGGSHNASLLIPTLTNGSVSVALTGTATGGITVDPAVIDFGTQPVGSVSGATLTVSADSPVTLTPPFSITGANAPEFFVGSPSTSTIGPGNDATVVVGFQPTSVGPKTASLLVSSLDGGSRTIPLSGSVACPTVTVLGSLPNGILGAPYSQLLSASGGADPYTFTVSGGGLPAGLMLSPGGSVSGVPTLAGSSNVTIRATDVHGCFADASYAVGIVAAMITATPSPLNFGLVTTGTSVSLPVTIKNTSSFAVTLLPPFAITGTGASLFAAGSPGTSDLAAGASTDVQVTFTPSVAGVANASLSLTSSNGGSATVTLSGIGHQVSVASGIVISEFRFRGPGGGNDEFVEIYNSTDASIDLSGWKINGSNNAGLVTNRTTVLAGTNLSGRSHYLFVSNGANGYSGAVPGDKTYGTGITDDGGVAIVKPDGTIADQVGLSGGSAYSEGTPLASLGTGNLDHSYERKPAGANGNGIDTDNNSSDFQVTTPSAPQNLASSITPALTVTPTSIDFGSVARGASTTATVTIANNAASPVSLTTPFAISGVDATEFAAGNPLTSLVGANSSTTALVTFLPATLGGKLATLTVAADDGETHQLLLGGLSVCPDISVSASLPNVESGVMYSQTISASGGIGPYAFVVTSGSLPSGLSLSSSGVLSGTTTALGAFAFTVQATENNGAESPGCAGTATFTLTVRRTLTAVGPASIWIGLKNSDDNGLRIDVRSELLVNGVLAASGELPNVSSGSNGFGKALLQSLIMSMSSGPVDVPAGSDLSVRVLARRTCFGTGHNSGTVREWFNGQPVDSGDGRDAGTRIQVTFPAATSAYFLRAPFTLATVAGNARQSADITVNSNIACPSRPYTTFGTWSVNLP
jgi:beta-lactamase superfamily II metal-dependent hydrolase/DNA/RNA endonuclease YhcR with UshA esterase domain